VHFFEPRFSCLERVEGPRRRAGRLPARGIGVPRHPPRGLEPPFWQMTGNKTVERHPRPSCYVIVTPPPDPASHPPRGLKPPHWHPQAGSRTVAGFRWDGRMDALGLWKQAFGGGAYAVRIFPHNNAYFRKIAVFNSPHLSAFFLIFANFPFFAKIDRLFFSWLWRIILTFYFALFPACFSFFEKNQPCVGSILGIRAHKMR